METITATIINFDETTCEAFATIGGTIALIDPFVTGLWDWVNRKTYLNKTYTFIGHWHGNSECKCFLPDRISDFTDHRTEITA